MASKTALKTQESDDAQGEDLQAVTLGEAIFTPSAAAPALADLLVARLSNLHTSQLLEDATACGVAVKAAFDQLEKADEGK